MIKSALEYLANVRKTEALANVDGINYRLNKDGTISEALVGYDARVACANTITHYKECNPETELIKTTTLQSIVDYVNADPDNFFADRDLAPIVHVKSPTTVTLYAQLDKVSRRLSVMQAAAIIPNISFEHATTIEQFIISMQSCFADTPDKQTLLKFVSKITVEASSTLKDTGASQTIEIRKGIVDVEGAKTPNPVLLAPMRSFIEIEQPQSLYVFRVHEGPSVSLHTAGGAEWQISAIREIGDFFRARIDHKNVHIIT